MNFKFCTHFDRIDRNKSPLTISGKVAVGVGRDSRKFAGHPYIGRCTVYCWLSTWMGGLTISVRNQSSRSTQPPILPGKVHRVPARLAGFNFKAGCVYLCRVAGNTVWSHMASDTP